MWLAAKAGLANSKSDHRLLFPYLQSQEQRSSRFSCSHFPPTWTNYHAILHSWRIGVFKHFTALNQTRINPTGINTTQKRQLGKRERKLRHYFCNATLLSYSCKLAQELRFYVCRVTAIINTPYLHSLLLDSASIIDDIFTSRTQQLLQAWNEPRTTIWFRRAVYCAWLLPTNEQTAETPKEISEEKIIEGIKTRRTKLVCESQTRFSQIILRTSPVSTSNSNKMVQSNQDNESLITLLCDESSIKQHKHQLQQQSRIHSLLKILMIVILTVVATSSVWTAVLFASSHGRHSLPITIDCGTSPSMAVSRGCKFQLWSYSWVPLPCYDELLDAAFLEIQTKDSWGYFLNIDGKENVEIASVLAGDRNDLFSTWGQHYWHCAFYQRKYFRMVENPKIAKTNRDLEHHHALHCQNWLADPFKYPWEKININLTVGFNTCYPWDLAAGRCGCERLRRVTLCEVLLGDWRRDQDK